MKNNDTVLIKALLRSTSTLNILKTSKDKKRRGAIIGGLIGMSILYAMIIAYCVLTAIGYGKFGLGGKMPGITALLITVIAFVFTLLKTNSYLFNFKEYDMLMALPFTEKTIVGSKFIYMYVKSLPWYLVISVSMLIGYGITVAPAWYIYPLWIVLSVAVSMIPMLIASLFGFLIAKIGSSFKHWKAVQTFLLFIFVTLCFFSRFFIEKLFRTNEVSDIVSSVTDGTDRIAVYLLPVSWFEKSICESSISSILLLIGVTIVLYEAVFFIFSRSYRRINSVMKTSYAKRNFKLKEQKKKSAVRAMAFKEVKRFLGSTNWAVNAGFGYAAAIILGIASLFIGLDKVIGTITQGAPITNDMILPAVPFVVYFLTGMMTLTTSSPSMEGKNYWIVKSLPMSYREIYGGKILAALYISVPSQLIATLCMCISARAGVIETIGYLILGVILCIFSAVFGCACGIHFMKLDWENDVEVIKQGAAVLVYMFPNMILSIVFLVGTVILAGMFGKAVAVGLAAFIYIILTVIFYFRVKALAGKR